MVGLTVRFLTDGRIGEVQFREVSRRVLVVIDQMADRIGAGIL